MRVRAPSALWALVAWWAGMSLAGCARGPAAPIDAEGVIAPHATRHQWPVAPGDTLYSIAWAKGLDYHDLAAWNGIGAPYRIETGEVLRLTAPSHFHRAAVSATGTMATPSSGVVAGAAAPAWLLAQHRGQITVPPPVALPSSPVPGRGLYPHAASMAAKAGSVTHLPVAPIPAPRRTRPRPLSPVAKAPAVVPGLGRGRGAWAWPANGSIVRAFDRAGGEKGIDIAGVAGSPIIAAAGGTVVYAGSGLRGYGELIILKNSDRFLSAYAHNERLLVREGDQVKQGQPIAEMGRSGTRRVMLHFEIRRYGKPVNPLYYLARRN